MASPAPLTISKLVARPVNVPMKRPLVTGGGTVGTAPLLLIDLHTKEGVIGRAYLFCYTTLSLRPMATLVANFNEIVAGETLAPFAIEQKLQKRLRLASTPGLIGAAINGIDMACWDALARAAEMPLVRLLGGTPRSVRAYNSCGLGLMGAERTAREAIELAENFPAVKLRLGYPDLATDIAVTRAVRKAVGDTILVMTDYNQCLSVPEAIARAHALDNEGVSWIEEPTTADDYLGNAAIARDAKTPIQIGENWWGPHEMAEEPRRQCLGFRDARCRPHRRCQRLAARRRPRRTGRRADVEPSLSRDQRASAGGDADLPLARICRLGRAGAAHAQPHRQERRGHHRRPRHRPGVG